MMKFAASMRYGGELVEASECNYQDYKHLGLLCPECKSSVFLVSGSKRSRKEKSFDVSAHFSHFKNVDPNLAQKCELRVAKYDEAEIEKRSAIARGQRLKLFQRCFWTWISKIPWGNEEDKLLEDMLNLHFKLIENNESYKQYIEELHVQMLPIFKNIFIISNRINAFEYSLINNNFDTDYNPPHLQKYMEDLKTSIDLRLHKQICSEAMAFLCSPRNHHLLKALYCNSVTHSIEKNYELTGSVSYPKFEQDTFELIMDDTISAICQVPWAIEFEKLSNQKS